MATFCKLYRSLWSRSYKLHRRTYVNLIPNTRKSISLNIILTENIDICNRIFQNDLPSIKWQDIREQFLQIQRLTTITVDATIMDVCLKNFEINKAIAYYKFLREHNYPLSVAIIGKYLRLYVFKQNKLTEEDKTEILATYNALRKKHPYLDVATAEHCIISLCLTDQWEKSHELIDIIKITSLPGITVYSALASAAFKNDKPAVAWESLSLITMRNLIPQKFVYRSHLQSCMQKKESVFDEGLEQMFTFWAENSLVPYESIISAYANAANERGWSAAATTISKMGRCEHCSYTLSNITFSDESFQELADSVMKNVIIGSDVYQNTNPQELQCFKKFIEDTKPYDIVIDGLNMTYTQNKSVPLCLMLTKVIDYFSKRGKKILVLTRKHQQKLSAFKYVQQNALVFFTHNLSSDDVYLLYAAMASGKDAGKFVSLDLMRQHKYLLKDERLKREFKKWQYSHQYFIRSKDKKFLSIREPFTYLPTAHKTANCWHIPYIDDRSTYVDSYEFPDKWYCFRHSKTK